LKPLLNSRFRGWSGTPLFKSAISASDPLQNFRIAKEHQWKTPFEAPIVYDVMSSIQQGIPATR
jgi:hypothetical protein